MVLTPTPVRLTIKSSKPNATWKTVLRESQWNSCSRTLHSLQTIHYSISHHKYSTGVWASHNNYHFHLHPVYLIQYLARVQSHMQLMFKHSKASKQEPPIWTKFFVATGQPDLWENDSASTTLALATKPTTDSWTTLVLSPQSMATSTSYRRCLPTLLLESAWNSPTTTPGKESKAMNKSAEFKYPFASIITNGS